MLSLDSSKYRLPSLRTVLIPFLIAVALLWVFNRPLTAVTLFLYNTTGSFLSTNYENLKQSRNETASLLASKELAANLDLENKSLMVENNALQTVATKLLDYQAALNFKTNFAYQTVFAEVVGRSPDSWHKQIIINKGSKDGIAVGLGALTERGIIGQVTKTAPHNSIVQLIFNPEWRMGVKIARLNQYGVLGGNHPQPASLQFITVDSAVELGDEIVTSGICIDTDNCPYPENFPVGRVVEVKRDPNVVDLVVKVDFYEDLSSIREVFILNHKSGENS